MHRATTVALVLGAALSAGVALVFAVRLGRTPSLATTAILVIGVGLPTLLALVLGFLSAGSADAQLAGILSLGSLALVLLAFELRFATDDPSQVARDRVARAARIAGREADTRSALQVVGAMRAHGDSAYPAMYGSAIAAGRLGAMSVVFATGPETTLVLANVANRTTVYCNENGAYATFVSDSMGFDNPDDRWSSRSLDAVVVGDSYAAGACVPRESGLTSALAREGIDAVNLGIGGSGPLAELARLREFAAPLSPRLVLWVFTEANDLDDLRIELRNPLLRRYLDAGYTQSLATRRARVEPAYVARFDSALADDGRLLGLAPTRRQRLGSLALRDVLTLQSLRTALGLPSIGSKAPAVGGPGDRSYDFDALRTILRQADHEVSAWGGRLVLVVIPDNSHFIRADGRFCPRCAPSAPLAAVHAARHRVFGIARALDITVVDVHERLSAHPDLASLFPYAGGHYSAAGYSFLAKSIATDLRLAGAIRGTGPRIALKDTRPDGA